MLQKNNNKSSRQLMNPIQAKIEKNQAKSKRNQQLLSHFKDKRMRMKSSVSEKKACFTAVGIVNANEHLI